MTPRTARSVPGLRRSGRSVAAVGVVALLAAACGVSAPSGPASGVPTGLPPSATPVGPHASAFDVAISSWSAALVGGRPVVAGREPTAAFGTDGVEGTTGCNDYVAQYRAANGEIAITDFRSTGIGCDDPVGAVERRFVDAMTGARTVTLDPDGRLLIDGPGGSITFVVAGLGG